MIIGGILKNSLIDFPAKISCVLFTAGCNFDCPYCHNPELVTPPFTSIDPEEIFAFLKKRKSLLDGVVITGGEPTLHTDLAAFCEKLKSLDYPVKLDTNGSQPHVVRALIQSRLIDYIAMDIKTTPENYAPHIAKKIDPDAILESIRLIKTASIAHEFRTTCVQPFVDAGKIMQIARLINGADLFVLQTANIGQSVLHPDFFTDKNWKVTNEEIISFQKIAAPFTGKTVIR